MNIKILNNEYWWSGIIHEGIDMPLNENSEHVVNFNDFNTPNQVMPLMLSSKGRFIYSEEAYCASFSKGYISTDKVVELSETGNSLRDAYIGSQEKYFPFKRTRPAEEFFSKPQYNTWIELKYNQTQYGILNYAENIIRSGLPSGILMIDEGWAADYGSYDFRADAFYDPKRMIRKLHMMGFKVMLWITPYISADSATFREIENKNYLLRDCNEKIAVRRWWNGLSSVLDLTNPEAQLWFKSKLDEIIRKYDIDGFKFDGGDPNMYREDDKSYHKASPWEHTRQYCLFGSNYKYNEFRVGWKNYRDAVVMRLSDKAHSWDVEGLNMLIPNSLMQSIMGFRFHCPDMIGGGEIKNFQDENTKIDEELYIRYAQAAALCPMMQFSTAPWRILNKKNFLIVKEAVRFHQNLWGHLAMNMEENDKIDEPLMRWMEYQFPHKGFEKITDQFMLGNSILVAPVLKKGCTKRTVVLPEGTWKDTAGKIWNGGNEIIFKTELNTIPCFFLEK